MGHAARRVGASSAHRRASRLRAERRLARWLSECAWARGSAPPHRRRGHAACHGPAGRLGGRGGRTFRPVLFGSSAAGGSMSDQDELRRLVDRDGVSHCPTRSEPSVSTSTGPSTLARSSTVLRRTWSCTSSRAPSSSLSISRWEPCSAPSASSAGGSRGRGRRHMRDPRRSTSRRDALAGAAKLALSLRDVARETGDGAVCTSGWCDVEAGIVTSVVETAEQLLDREAPRREQARIDARPRPGASRGGSPRRRTSTSRGADLEHRADPVR